VTEKKPDSNTAIVIGDDRRISAPRSRMISRGLENAESLEKTVLTIVRDIIVDIDKNGGLKRRGIIDPVCIKGEQISEVSLGPVLNAKELLPEQIVGYDFRIGDTISIEHLFEPLPVRPWLTVKVVKEKRTGNEKVFTIPTKCPACGCKIKMRRPDWPAYYCTGTACPGRIKAQLIAFSDSMHIDLKPELAKELVDKRMVSDSADLYFLKKKDLMRLNKMDEESAQRFLDAIERSRHPELANIIIALLEMGGIPLHIGLEVAFRCNSINDLFDNDMLAQIKPNKYRLIQPNQILAVQKLVNEKKTLKFLDKLKKGGVVFPRKGGD